LGKNDGHQMLDGQQVLRAQNVCERSKNIQSPNSGLQKLLAELHIFIFEPQAFLVNQEQIWASKKFELQTFLLIKKIQA